MYPVEYSKDVTFKIWNRGILPIQNLEVTFHDNLEFEQGKNWDNQVSNELISTLSSDDFVEVTYHIIAHYINKPGPPLKNGHLSVSVAFTHNFLFSHKKIVKSFRMVKDAEDNTYWTPL